MSVDHIRYDLLVREALRGVVRRVVTDVARNGLPGDHHFYIAFDTRAPGVRLSPRLREQYPEEMTIVLQHQFWDLSVTDIGLEVGLAFGGIAEKLFVPFDAMKGFFDPSVQFGLEFEVVAAEKAPDAAAAPEPAPAPAPSPVPATPRRRTPDAERKRESGPSASAPSAPEGNSSPAGGAEVVPIDRFRKK